jgi:hypothetical protein
MFSVHKLHEPKVLVPYGTMCIVNTSSFFSRFVFIGTGSRRTGIYLIVLEMKV